MRVNTRITTTGAVLAASALILTGCASQGDGGNNENTGGGSNEQSLTVWVDAERVAALEGVVAAYEEEKGIDINIVSKDAAKMKDDFSQQASTETGPDIVMGAHDWLGELVTNGVVAPIELGDSSSNYLDVAVQAASYEGATYLLPFSVENLALLRNADLVPEAAANFDDMIAKGEAAGAEYPFIVQQGAEGDPYHLYPFQTAFNAPVFGLDAEGNYNSEDLQLAEGEGFATWLGEQGANGTISTEITGDIASEKFLAGDAAFWLTGPWNVSVATEAGINLAVDPIASPSDMPASPFAGVKGFVVNEYSDNKVAANDFLVNFVGTEEVQTALYESSSVVPALTASAEAAASDPIVAGFLAAGEQAVPMPAIPEMGSVWEFWGVTEAAILGGSDPATSWQKLVADVQGAIQ
ncbi:sugar ABC transporter substrate-binding protein [Humidisolicoccus flavus]|uniref:sugar ABC transporter substrate-binding protein n=1 Tax=Humidisolicoccus flavus TaxID=3111414 RepID=UPI0032476B89